MLHVNSELFRDKVYGCWLGKNCGGTLGAPLEKAYGEPEPLDVWWYPELQEGGIPNDDLEMQLIWLKALEEVGPGLRAADLAQYWLDHIGYNWDEYGLSKTNLRLGLRPPLSGYYNNWFKDCMGCPIRSEIWACIAPGVPSLAVRYAYEDAICDHAGGESVFGELFNTAIESAAFVLSDRERLLDIGLSYVPSHSQTAKAIRAARAAYADGVDWKTARKRVLAATPHYVAQYSPINMGFQVIGWLYGEDFGDAICKAVNCGYDTDCTGATLGSILGIIAGRSGLPQKWTQPLGEDIATNESWGGLRHASTGSNPVPTTLTELTERVCTQAIHVLTSHALLRNDGSVNVESVPLFADERIHAMWSASPTRIDYQQDTLSVGIEYKETPAVRPDEQKSVQVHLTNSHQDAFVAQCELQTPGGWEKATSGPQSVIVPPESSVVVEWNIAVPQHVENSNHLFLNVAVEGQPVQPATPVVLLGAYRYLHSDVYPLHDATDRECFDEVLGPEHLSSTEQMLAPHGRAGTWTDLFANENALPLQEIFSASGVLYVRTYLWSPVQARSVWMGVDANCPTKAWVNHQRVIQVFDYPPVRPNYNGSKTSGRYAVVELKEGWNEVLLKFVRSYAAPTFDGYLLLSEPAPLYDGLYQVGRTRTPWDK